jgi:anti-sigma factor RsiW
VAQEKGHLTTEQLSSLLDREASAEEQAQWEVHLSTCPQCQQEQAGLRQTVVLLHALPQPTPPRSFALPLEAPKPLPISHITTPPTPIRRAPRRTLNPHVRRVLRTMSAIAAVIGVVFFLSGVLPSLAINGANGTATSTASNGSAASSSLSPHIASNTPAATRTPAATNTATPTSKVTSTAGQVVKPQPPDDQKTSGGVQYTATNSEPTFFIFNLGTQAGRVGLGMLLVILGLMGYVLFKDSRRRTS